MLYHRYSCSYAFGICESSFKFCTGILILMRLEFVKVLLSFSLIHFLSSKLQLTFSMIYIY